MTNSEMALLDQDSFVVLSLRDASCERNGVVVKMPRHFATLPLVSVDRCNHGSEDLIEELGSRVCPSCITAWMVDWEVFLPADTLCVPDSIVRIPGDLVSVVSV